MANSFFAETFSCICKCVLIKTITHTYMSVPWDRSVVFPGIPVSSTNKADRHDIAEILLEVALDTINIPQFLCQHTITGVYKYLKLQ
jgi:hypothetical protein